MLSTLARASIDGAVFAGLIWLLTRLMPRLSPAAKTFLWWLVSVKFIVALIWTAPIPLPVLPPVQTSALVVATGTSVRGGMPALGDALSSRAPGWTGALTALWAGGATGSLVLGWRRWRKTRTTIARSSGAPESIHDMTRDVATRLRVSRVPDVRLSDAIDTPLVAGVTRPAIVVPASRFERLGVERQRMTLCHELAHIKRRDLWFGSAVALAERLFFFHPLAHLAAREYVFWREAACDAAVIDALGATPHEYGRLLLDLGISAPRRTLAAAGAPWSFGNLKRRIVMLGRPSSASTASRLAAVAALTIATLGIVPLTLTARSAPLPAEAMPLAPHAPTLDAAVPAVPAGDPQSPAAPQPKDDRTPFVAFRGDDEVTVSGSSDDTARARQLRRSGETMLWFRRNGIEYIVRDQWVMQEVREIWRNVGEIGGEQWRLGAKQGVLGAQQAALGGRQGELGVQQATLGLERAALALREAAVAQREVPSENAAERTILLRERLALQAKSQDLTQLMRDLEAKMRELQAPMEDLAQRMTAMSKDMEALGGRMTAATAEAEAKMRDLIDRAVASGLAQIVR